MAYLRIDLPFEPCIKLEVGDYVIGEIEEERFTFIFTGEKLVRLEDGLDFNVFYGYPELLTYKEG